MTTALITLATASAAVLSTDARLSSVASLRPVTPASLTLGRHISSGNFGEVLWATVEGEACVAKRALSGVKRARAYLETEACINARLSEARHVGRSSHLAEYLGEAVHGGERHLVWRAAGSTTLLQHIERPDGFETLAAALGAPSPAVTGSVRPLGYVLMRQLLEALACVHAAGVVHRDVKPDNLLVDPHSRSLRLVDFGSACAMGDWLHRRGYDASRCPCSTLYCAPEQLLVEDAPYAFDVYSAAVVWLRTMVSSLRPSEQALFDLRIALRDHAIAHDFGGWHRTAASRGTLPVGWSDAFGGFGGFESAAGGAHMTASETAEARETAALLELLDGMLRHEPRNRPSAAAALRGGYINRHAGDLADGGCGAPPVEPPPARPWTAAGWRELLLSGTVGLGGLGRDVSDECRLPGEDGAAQPTLAGG